MNTKSFIAWSIRESVGLKKAIVSDCSLVAIIEQVADAAVIAYRSGHKILLAGNGGSAADAQHLAGEFVNRFRFDRPALPAVALTTDTSVLTCISNDSSFDNVFARQVQALGERGDMFWGFSTSGGSHNVLNALKICRAMKITGVGFTGMKSARMKRVCDYCIAVPSADTPRIQESHIMIGHILCDIIESRLFGKRK